MVEPERLLAAYDAARHDLLARRTPAGNWKGELSSSALSTATAISALAIVRRHWRAGSPESSDEEERISQLIFRGLAWLADAQNADGGWGDTDKSLSNIATTMLVRAAFQLTCVPAEHADLIERADAYIAAQGGIAGLRRRYGKDKTFAVPILTNYALAGLVSWREVSPLPFELACFPQSWFRFLQLPVVSYAIPALVAIGQARYFHRKPRNPLARAIRAASVDKSLRVLEQMQPASGGFLEATPLTSFVVMSLASIGQDRHPVTRRGVEFLLASARPDGSWPIDTNLATWVTTLSINALAAGQVPGSRFQVPGSKLADCNGVTCGGDDSELATVGERCIEWLLNCQVREVHPYTGAAPGGWGWSDLSGSVPDADDTPGALLTLAALRPGLRDEALIARIDAAAAMGIGWLLDLQNSDGGWPTFCRGWAKLPFDRSGADLTAHVLRAFKAWQAIEASASHSAFRTPRSDRSQFNRGADAPRSPLSTRLPSAIGRGFAYLARVQQSDGSWLPLWFGNQHHPQEENPVYGTARVLLAYSDFDRLGEASARRGLAWLAEMQNADGGWGGLPGGKHGAEAKSSVEETALAVEALLAADDAQPTQVVIERGLAWLVEAVEGGRHAESSPLGFYFAKLWYYEALYPLIFTAAALGRAVAGRRSRATHVKMAAACEIAPAATARRTANSCQPTLR